jgi:hypothetical protein
MIDWQPIGREALLARVAQGVARMGPAERRLWTMMRIEPVKWRQDPYGRDGEGFWVVGLIGASVIWYNDIEDGFNRSKYATHGEIQDYWCNQDELEVAVNYLVSALEHGADLVGLGVPSVLWGGR